MNQIQTQVTNINILMPNGFTGADMASVIAGMSPEQMNQLLQQLQSLEGRNGISSDEAKLNQLSQDYNAAYGDAANAPQTAAQWGVAGGETAKVWGDPHFVDADGGKFDFQGQAGKTYNLLNDTGLVLNGRFDDAGNGTTVIGEAGLTVSGLKGTSSVQFSKDPNIGTTINGVPIQPGAMETLADGSHAHLSPDGNTLTIKTAEGYTLTEKRVDGRIDIDVKSPREGVATDGNMPGGLIGQTFDADKLARNSGGKQGEGAINGSPTDYEVPGGVFGQVNPAIQSGVSPTAMNGLGQLMNQAGINPPDSLPSNNPVTGEPVDWSQSVTDQNMEFMTAQAAKQQSAQKMDDQNREGDKELQLLMMALSMGNIDMAMLIFASMESKQSTRVTQALTKKMVEAQQKRRQLTEQMGKLNDKDNKKKGPQLQNQVQEVNDTIQLLTSFIKDVTDQKNRTMEFANNFLSSEHQTTMSIVRGMKG